MMKRYGLLGQTLSHSLSPQIHALFGEYTYELIEKQERELASFFADPSPMTLCANCFSHFERGLFLASGTVNDPSKKGYHLEILLKCSSMRSMIVDMFYSDIFKFVSYCK